MLTAGIDCGVKTTKTVVLKDGEIVARAAALTGFDLKAAARESLAKALLAARMEGGTLERIAATGSGGKAIGRADLRIDGSEAMAAAGRWFFPSARTVVDVGAEDARAAKIDEDGGVVDAVVNEKCAAGAGSFVEAMARALAVSPEEMGRLSLAGEKQIPINAQCAVFAESEVVGLIHSGASTADIGKAVHDAMASRIAGMVRRVGVHEDVVLIGGMGRNRGFVRALKKELKLGTILIPAAPEYGGALGAAVAAEKA